MKTRVSDAVNVTCSFCGKNNSEVKHIIAGPTVFICNECIDLCRDILMTLEDGSKNVSSAE